MLWRALMPRRAPDRFAIRDRFRRLTYRELIGCADALADDLAAHGVRPGDRVLLWLPSRIEVAVIHLACSRQGYVFCPSPHRNHTVAEVMDLLVRTRCAAFFYQPDFGADAGRFRYGCRTRQAAVVATDLPQRTAGGRRVRPVG